MWGVSLVAAGQAGDSGTHPNHCLPGLPGPQPLETCIGSLASWPAKKGSVSSGPTHARWPHHPRKGSTSEGLEDCPAPLGPIQQCPVSDPDKPDKNFLEEEEQNVSRGNKMGEMCIALRCCTSPTLTAACGWWASLPHAFLGYHLVSFS